MDLFFRNSPDAQRIKRILANPGTMGTVLHSICLREFDAEMYEWEPETLSMEIEDEFGIPACPAAQNRLDALISALVSESFYQDWVAYAMICTSLSSEDGDPDIDGPIPTAMLAWGTLEVKLNDSTPGVWGPEVRRYAGAIQHEDGLVRPLDALSFAKMPSVYQGSTYGPELNQQKAADSEHRAVYETFLEEQSLLLFKQLSFLPWMTPEKLQELQAHL